MENESATNAFGQTGHTNIMDTDYASMDAALNFQKLKKVLPNKSISIILEKLRLKNKEIKSDDVMPAEFGSMADAGCGSGRTIKFFVPHFKSITAFDPSEAQINLAKKTHPFDNVTYQVGCGEAMPVPDNSVDLVTFFFSAFYLDMEKFEKELNRVLKPNGLAVFYGDMVSGIDLIVNDSNESAFPELRSDVKKLWMSCIQNIKDYAKKVNHPERHHFNKLKDLCQSLKTVNIERDDTFEFHEASSLKDFLDFYRCVIPCFSQALKAMEVDPLEKFVKQLKRMWKIPDDVDDNDVKLKITRSSYFIFLDKIN